MPNTLTGFTDFIPGTRIRSSEVDANFAALKNGSPLWQKYTVGFASFVALGATATGSVVLASLTAAEVTDGYIVKHSQAVAGTSITAAVVRLGKVGTDDQYTDDFDVFQAVGAAAAQLTGGLQCNFSTTSLIITMSLTGGLLSQLSTGSIDVYVRKADLP